MVIKVAMILIKFILSVNSSLPVISKGFLNLLVARAVDSSNLLFQFMAVWSLRWLNRKCWIVIEVLHNCMVRLNYRFC